MPSQAPSDQMRATRRTLLSDQFPAQKQKQKQKQKHKQEQKQGKRWLVVEPDQSPAKEEGCLVE